MGKTLIEIKMTQASVNLESLLGKVIYGGGDATGGQSWSDFGWVPSTE